MINFQNKSIMIIAPHLDDEIIGCSGTILLNRDKINKLIVVHMTDDDIRKKEYKNIKQALKINKDYMLQLKDGFVNNSYEEAVLTLIDIIQIEKPDIVFIPHAADNHVDHSATNKISIDAIEKARYWNCEEKEWHVDYILEYEIWSFQKSVSDVIDISDIINKKIELMKQYQSQLRFNYLKYIEYINGYRGLLFNRGGFAECFNIRRN